MIMDTAMWYCISDKKEVIMGTRIINNNPLTITAATTTTTTTKKNIYKREMLRNPRPS